ncbi:hypothetical protein SBOR_5301 [Sclerotinia borealis F-4128]|uniref:Uncharacterized protein n=1 Tax=Sclerotinia borealis (strain F-4128) TaxID=1432307 RepID=W9CIH6_SCLBF|nr:hypothetical protein SBOR_5301 [Sclerotinia borealis F-4128]
MEGFSPGTFGSTTPHKDPDITNGSLMGHVVAHFYDFDGDPRIIASFDSNNIQPSLAKQQSSSHRECSKEISDYNFNFSQTRERMISPGLEKSDDDVPNPHVIRFPDKSSRRDAA